MPRVTTEALVLHRVPFGETSQVAELLTRDAGRLSLILKGVHRSRDRKGGGVDLLDHCLVVSTRRRGSRALPQLVERRVLSHHPVSRRRADLLAAGSYLVELLRAFVPEGQRVDAVFDLALAFLESLEEDPPPEALPARVFALAAGILRATGFQPVLDRCVACDRMPSGPRAVRCDPVRGGVVCSRCRNGSDPSFLLSAKTVEALRALDGLDPRQAPALPLPRPVERQMQHYFERVFSAVLERPPRCPAPVGAR